MPKDFILYALFGGHFLINYVYGPSGTCTNSPSADTVKFASRACKIGISCNFASGTCTNGKSGYSDAKLFIGTLGTGECSLKNIVYYFKRFLPLLPSSTCICWMAIWLSFTRRSP